MPRFELTRQQDGQVFSYHKGAGRPRETVARTARFGLGAVLLAALLACGACSTLGFSEDDQLVTGSITPRPTPVAAPVPEGAPPKGIAEADWIEAKRALEQAIAAHAKDESVPWENKISGAHGTATPIGAERAGGCRDFIISVVTADTPDRWIQGTACRARDDRTKGALVLSQVRMLDRA